MKVFKLITGIIAVSLTTFSAFAQPTNDDCSGATNMGSLPTPGACISGLQNGAVTTLNAQTTVGATSPALYTYQTACVGGGNMTTFALDTWYSFVATGTTVNINVTGFPNANIGIYSGTCGNLLGRGCTIANGAGNGTLVTTQIIVGQTYYIQISGNTTTATDASFSLAVDNDIDCNDCLTTATLTANPLPVNGGYTPGQVVQFCYTVTNYNEVNTNWFHGVQVSAGPGWTGTYSGITPAADCNVDVTPGAGDAGDGVWSWYPAGITSSANGSVWPMGFYFDNSNVAGTNAGNNFGDPGNCDWTFCWSLTVSAACAPGTSLAVTVNTTGDGESGSWPSLACSDDPPSNFSAFQVCCTAPTMAATPVTCLGGANGTATATHGTGSSPWDYSWTNSSGTNVGSTMNSTAASNTVSGLVAGTYTVTITDNVGCVTTNTVIVNPGTLPVVNAGVDQTVCIGTAVTLSGAGASTYIWDNGVTNAAAFTPPSGLTTTITTYTVTGTSVAGCIATDQVIVTVNPLATVDANINQSVCALGNITLAGIIGGSATSSNWSAPSGSFSNTASLSSTYTPSIASGTVTLTLTTNDPTGPCAAVTDIMIVTINPLNTIAAGTSPSLCINSPLTDITLATTGATGATFSILPAGVTGSWAANVATISGTPTAPGAFNYTVTTIGGCPPAIESGTITVNALPIVGAGNNQTICANTQVTLTGSGATTYSWNNGVTNGTAFTPPSGITTTTTTYTVTGTNTATGCTNTDQVDVIVNPIPIVNAGPDVSICITGSATLTATGATSYSWAPGGQLTAAITVTPIINSTYTVTGTSLGCSASDAVTVTVLANAPINAGPDIDICLGGSTTLNATAGVTYNWAGLGTNSSYLVSPTSNTTYTVTGTDANNCVGSDAVTITVFNPATVNANIDLTVCANDTVNLAGSFGGGASSALWSAPSGLFSNASNINSTYSPTAASGTVTLTLTTNDPVGPCPSVSDQMIVSINPNPSVTVNNPTVCGLAPATVIASPTPAGLYNYVWTVPPGASAQGNTASFNAGLTGSYSVIITNPLTGCFSPLASGVATINPIPVITLTPTDPLVCNATNGTIVVNGTGTGTVIWTGTSTGSTAGASLPYTIPSLGSGNYNVTFTNAATGCVSSTVTTTLNNPGAPVINVMPNLTSCGTSITINESSISGTNLTSNIGFFSSPNGVGPIADGTVFNSPTPLTTIYVYDANGLCTFQVSFTVTINPIPTVSLNSPTFCGSSPAALLATPGIVGNYNYTWSVPLAASNPGNLATFNTNINGNYSIVITDNITGCVSQPALGSVNINPNPTVTVNSSTVCSGTAATVTATPGIVGNYDYSWTVPPGATAPGNVASFSTSTSLNYSVTITDPTTLCFSSSASGSVIVNPLPTATISGNLTLCQNESQPSVTLTGSNGTAPYTFTYALNGGANQTITSIGNTATILVPTATAGTFTYSLVNVIDASITACSQAQTGTAIIIVNSLPTGTITGTASVCEGGASQIVTFTGANGTSPYTFAYNINNGPVQTITSVGNSATISVPTSTPGIFNYNLVSVEDASSTTCAQNQTGTAIVTINTIPVVFAGYDVAVCENQTVTLTASGAATYSWDNSIINGVAFNPPAGTTTYTVTGTSAEGCINTDQVNVTLEPAPVVSFTPNVTFGCVPLTVNFTNTTPNSGNGVWTISDGTVLTGTGTVANTFTQAGCFDVTLTITSTNGCIGTFTAIDLICTEATPIASFSPSASVISELNTVVNFNNTTTGAVDYVWNFGDNTPNSIDVNPTHDYTNATIGNYIVTLIAYSPFGCVDTAYSTIQIYEELIFYVPNTFTPDDDDYNPTFQPIFTSGYDPYDYTLLIFNRWGEIIFESHNTEVGWDGSYGENREVDLVQDGTYTWKIEFKTNRNDERIMRVGHVNIIR